MARVTLEDLYTLLNNVNDNLSTKIDNIKKEVDTLNKKLDQKIEVVEDRIEALETENRNLKKKLNETEKILKKRNIILKGLAESESEDIVEKVIDLSKNKLGINLKIEDISECFRLGTPTQNKARPILLVLVSGIKKSELVSQRRLLKGSNIYISDDLSLEERKEKRLLGEKLKEARAQNKKAFIKGNKLLVDGESYSIEDFERQESDLPLGNPKPTENPTTQSSLSSSEIVGQQPDRSVISKAATEGIAETERKRKVQELSINESTDVPNKRVQYRTRLNSSTTTGKK